MFNCIIVLYCHMIALHDRYGLVESLLESRQSRWNIIPLCTSLTLQLTIARNVAL